MDNYFRTHSGKHVHTLSPAPSEIDINDIARALSHICRFLGHTEVFYCVAQHSVLVSQLVPRADALWGLLHDAAEAYLCDLPRPVKREPRMEIYRVAEDSLLACIALKFGMAPEMPETVKLADLLSNTASIVAHDPNFAVIYLAEKAALLPNLKGGSPTLYARVEKQLAEAVEALRLRKS